MYDLPRLCPSSPLIIFIGTRFIPVKCRASCTWFGTSSQRLPLHPPMPKPLQAAHYKFRWWNTIYHRCCCCSILAPCCLRFRLGKKESEKEFFKKKKSKKKTQREECAALATSETWDRIWAIYVHLLLFIIIELSLSLGLLGHFAEVDPFGLD